MSAIEKIKDSFLRQIGITAALIVTGLIAWALSQIAPVVLPVIVKVLPNRAFVGVLLLSIVVNVVLAVVVWWLAKPKKHLKLCYGILWDKEHNPHCPVCKSGGLQYGKWNYAGRDVGYRCNKCEAVFGLTTAAGELVTPEDALRLL